MPPLSCGAYLINIVFEIGPAKPTGMGGMVAIDEIDIASWQSNRDLRLSAWEARMLRHLSQVYASSFIEYRDPKASAPYLPEPSQISQAHRERISKAMADWADKVNGKRVGQ